MQTYPKPAGRWLCLVLAVAMCLSLVTVPALAVEETAPGGIVANMTQDSGEDFIALTTPRSFEAVIPVSLTEAEAKAAAGQVQWSLLPDGSKPYLDKTLFPNQTAGGPLDTWLCADGETPLFSGMSTEVTVVEGQVYLTMTFDSACYFGTDPSVPHTNGGAYMDVCGYFLLTATLDGKTLGEAGVKITPYDSFHTMAEIYTQIDGMVAFAKENTDLYVQKFSMGMSQGDNGLTPLDMPYLIVAKNRAAVDKWLSIADQAETDPAALLADLKAGKLGNYQVPVMFSNVHANEVSASDGILQFAQLLLDAAAGDGAVDYDVLTGFTAAGQAELKKQLGPAGQKDSVAVPDLVKNASTFLGYLKAEGQSVSAPVDLDQFYTTDTKTVQVDDLLDELFFIIVPEENVEGRTYLTRTSSGGFDLNRDNSFQTQSETQNMTRLIATWNPVSFTEFHGRVKAFQCEPCDPPHEPNFEYDLLSRHLMAGGEALGIAAVANNDGYNSYVIPQRDYLTYTGQKNADGSDETRWLDPWDDMSTSYTPQYAMLHGTVAYTVEVPAYNDHTARAVAYGQLGQAAYVADNKDGYLQAQAEIFQRGVTNFNSNAYELVGQWFADQYDAEGAEATLFRPVYDGAGQNGNFYPECYIIPLDAANQKNLQAAADMMVWLARNDVKILVSDKAFTYGGVTYPAGTMVVTMYQAKRSVANGVLYNGTVITEWPVLYSEGITAFNKTRGFDMVTCAEPEAYKTIRAACGSFLDYEASLNFRKEFTSAFTGTQGGKVIVANASEDSTAAVNALLQGGHQVGLILSGAYKGSFICDYAAYQTVADKFVLTATGVTEDLPLSLSITKAPTVYISGKPADSAKGFVKSTLTSGAYQYNYDRQAMELLGFQTTDNAAQADLVIGAAALDAAAAQAVRAGTPYIGYGSNAMASFTGSTDRSGNKIPGLLPEGALVRTAASENAMDALAYVTYPTESMVTASYVAEGDDILYGYGAGYFSAIPQGARVLVQLDGSKSLLEGFLNSDGEHYKDFLNSSVQAISYEKDGLDLVLFANTLTHKVHQRDEFNFIANAAFSALLGEVYTGTVSTAEEAALLADLRYDDVTTGDWFASAVGQSAAQGLLSGTSATAFGPLVTTDRAMLVTVLYRMAGAPAAEAPTGYTDVAAGTWYTTAVGWAQAQGITSGTSATTFAPAAPLTREQAVTMIMNYAKSRGAEIKTSGSLSAFRDADQVSAFAVPAMTWAVEQGLVTGTGDGSTLAPKASATRGELAALILRASALFQ